MEKENAEEKIRQAVLAIRKARANPAGRHWLDVAEGFLAQALALSRLAARKDEGQALTVEQVRWLRMVLGRALYRVEHFPEQSNDEGIEADELARAIILLGGEPATTEPRPAEEPAPAPSEEDIILVACEIMAPHDNDPSGFAVQLYFERLLGLPDSYGLTEVVEALRSQLAQKDEALRKALVYLPEYLRHLRARNDPKALSLTNDLEGARAALSSPHPEAREEDIEAILYALYQSGLRQGKWLVQNTGPNSPVPMQP